MPHSFLAQQLGVSSKLVKQLDASLSRAYSKKDVLTSLASERETKISHLFSAFNLPASSTADLVLETLWHEIEDQNNQLSKLVGPDLADHATKQNLLSLVTKVLPPPTGYFLKLDRAEDLLRSHPPRGVIKFLGRRHIEEVLAQDDLRQVFASLRFLEDRDWLNQTFFKAYASLTPADFELRPVELIVMDDVWRQAAAGFIKKKWHNISHLKELGLIFVLPNTAGGPGELVRTLALLFHYLHEVPFYSQLIQAASTRSNFAGDLTSLLRGDVSETKPASETDWLVIQRYLEKDDSLDWRLFWPHLNTESLLYYHAESRLSDLADIAPELGQNFALWNGLDWVGSFLPNDSGGEELVSFDLLDVVMSLVKKDTGLRYTYHQHEALWNKFFAAYAGYDYLEKLAKDNLLAGSFKV